MADSETSFKTEKQNVLGELSSKFRKFSAPDDDLPPPPPVFQTYGTPVPGENDDLPPPPPFLQVKVDTVDTGLATPPPPPPPPCITPPDYSKLAPKKQEDDNCIKPRLNPVSQNQGKSDSRLNSYANPYLNSRSEDYTDSLLRPNTAEKKTIPIITPSPPPPPVRNMTPAASTMPRSTPTPPPPPPTRSPPPVNSTAATPSPPIRRPSATSSPSPSNVRRPSITAAATPSPPIRRPSTTTRATPASPTPAPIRRPSAGAASPVRRPSASPPTSIRAPSASPPPPPRNWSSTTTTRSGRSSLDLTMKEMCLNDGQERAEDDSNEDELTDTEHCYSCKQRINIDGIVAMERAYHKDCFQCVSCGKVIQARFNVKDKQPFCDICFQEEAERCNICSGLITGDSLKSGNKYFHPYCMKCSVCSIELSGTYFTTGNALVCPDCHKATLEHCSVCGDVLSGAFYKVADDNICEKCYKNQLSLCPSCQTPVEGKMLKLSDKVYHPACFNCSVCERNLAGVAFTQDDEKKIHCTECFQKKHASICAGCTFAIIPEKGETTAERIRVQGKDFHPKCFKCEDCELKFDSRTPGHECYPLDTAFLCRVCNLARINNSQQKYIR